MKTIALTLGALLVAGLLSTQPAQARCFWDGVFGWQCTPELHPVAPPPLRACFPIWPFCT